MITKVVPWLFYPIFTLMIIISIYQLVGIWGTYGKSGIDAARMMLHLTRLTGKAWMIPSAIFSLGLFFFNTMFVAPQITFSPIIPYGFFAITISTIAWNLKPPATLFLATSAANSYEILRQIRWKLVGERIVALLPPGPHESLGPHQCYNWMEFFMHSFRTVDDSKWQSAVRQLMVLSRTILLDARTLSPHILEEVKMIFEDIRLMNKACFIVSEDGRSAVLDYILDTWHMRFVGIKESELDHTIDGLKAIWILEELAKQDSPLDAMEFLAENLASKRYTSILGPNGPLHGRFISCMDKLKAKADDRVYGRVAITDKEIAKILKGIKRMEK